MNRIRHTLSRWLGLPVTLLMLALGPVLPLLDGQEGAQGPVLEQEHTAATCVVGHDHRICILAGSLRGLLSHPRPLPLRHVEVGSAPATVADVPPRGPVPSLVQPRAPPVSV